MRILPSNVNRANIVLVALHNRINKTMANESITQHERELCVRILIADILEVTQHQHKLIEEYNRDWRSDDNYGSRPGENGYFDYELATDYSESCSDRYENLRNQE